MWPRATQILTGVVFFSTLGGACAVDTELTDEEQARADAEAKLLECTGDQHCWDVCEERSRSVCIDGACAGCNLRQALLGDDDDSADCSEDLDCATKCVEGDTVICVDGLCDDCTLRTIDCTIGGAECVENCEEGEDAECDPDYLTCDACTPK